MPEPAPASHPSPSGLKRLHGDSREVHTRSMYEYDIITRLLCPFFSMLLRWMYRILLLCCVLSVVLWLFQLGFDIIQLLVVSTRPWEQPENPQVVMGMVTALVIRCLLPSIFCQKQRRLVFLYPLSSVVPVLVNLLFSWVFPWLLQLFTRLWGGQPENPQLEVEILAASVVVLQWLQFIFCRERFRRNRLLVQWGAWAAYYAPLPLEAFAVGVMLKFRCPYWLVAIFFAAGQADSMAAYRLDDDSQKVRRFAKRTLMLAYLILALLQLQGEGGSVPCRRRRPIADMYSLTLGLFVFLVHLKITSMEMIPSIDICMVAAEAVRHRGKRTTPARRAVVAVGSLESRGTAVSGCTTYKDILHLNYSSELKDACLSSASFLQLLQRYSASQSQAEVVDSSSSVNNILRADKSTKDGYRRAFKIVEVELSFLYDYFFSTHGSPSHTSYRLYNDYSISKIGFLFSILSLVYPADEEEAAKAKPELGASVYAVYALILLELCQLVVYLTSNWLVVSVMCDRAKNSRHTSPLLRILGALFRRAGSQQRRWPNELGQYVLIENCHRTSLKERLLGSLLGLRQRGSLGSPIALSDEMKRWVLDKAAADHSGFTFPIDDELSWAWRQDTEARTILIWHIATWFCAKTEEKMVFPTSACGLLSLPEYRVAVTLSSYCAYLVTFRPELLPGHHTIAASVFDEAITEAELHLEDQTSPSERYTRMATWLRKHDPSYQRLRKQGSPDQGILKLGVRLGRQLIDMEGSSSSSSYKYWKTIANFWIEMLLHVAQADNVTAHIEHLAKGGEFVTHLWALLSHAGIKRNSPFDFKQTKDDGAKSGQAYESKGKGRAN